MALDAPTLLVLTLPLRSVLSVRKVQKPRDAAVSQQLLLSGRQGASGAMSPDHHSFSQAPSSDTPQSSKRYLMSQWTCITSYANTPLGSSETTKLTSQSATTHVPYRYIFLIAHLLYPNRSTSGSKVIFALYRIRSPIAVMF